MSRTIFIVVAAVAILAAALATADLVIVKICKGGVGTNNSAVYPPTMSCNYGCKTYVHDTAKGCFSVPGLSTPLQFNFKCKPKTRSVFGNIFVREKVAGTCSFATRYYAIEGPCDVCQQSDVNSSQKVVCRKDSVAIFGYSGTTTCSGTNEKLIALAPLNKCTNIPSFEESWQPLGFQENKQVTFTSYWSPGQPCTGENKQGEIASNECGQLSGNGGEFSVTCVDSLTEPHQQDDMPHDLSLFPSKSLFKRIPKNL